MKLNTKLILFSFIIVVITSAASAIIYYSLTDSLLTRYQSQSISNSTNDFIFVFETSLQQVEYDIKKISPSTKNFNRINLDSTSIDFLFTLENDSLININQFKKNKNVSLNLASRSIKKFFEENPNVVLSFSRIDNNEIIYYGKVLNSDFLSKISEKIRADIALIIDNQLYEISNPDKNQKFIPALNHSIQNLKFKNNYDIYNEETDNADFKASLYTPRQILAPAGKLNFIIFTSFEEAADFRNTLRNVVILIVVAGSALTFIFVLLFTYKFRKQLTLLSEATEITTKGNLEHRVTIISKDEIGSLGEAFNKMLDVIKKKEDIEKEYTEFIKLINQNPTLKQVSEAALTKIIKATGCSFGLLYVIENKTLRLTSSYGINRDSVNTNFNSDLYSNVIDKKESVEFIFENNFPEIKTGLASIKLKYLLIYPILYNKEPIAILELASENIPQNGVKNYLNNIQEHLAIGLINAVSLEQLENYISELKRLNEEYQKQNKQIIQQNEQLKELHNQLREKAEELEKQRLKAVELTKVKSQFLASMSHELRTPLISILGLTELLLKDSYYNPKFNEKLNIVYRNGKKLLRLITNILEFSRLESGKIEVKKEKFLLSELIEEVKQNFEIPAEDKKLKFSIEAPRRKNILLNTDKNKLDHILSNLLMNAIKFTERGEVKLSIELIDTNSIKFSVIDTGMGIPEEKKELIFAEFKQIETNNSKHFGGAGLGLAICKRYVELLGGKLSLDSHVDKGTKFSFTLNDVVVEIIETNDDSFLKVKDDYEESKKSSALIIGSSENANKLVKDYLITYNYLITICESGRQSLETISKQKFNSIIINSYLNDYNIWQLIADIRKNPAAQETPIIIYNVIENEKVGWAPNVFDFLIKPVTENILKNLINQIKLFTNKDIDKIIYTGLKKEEYEIIKDTFSESIDFDYRNSLESSMALIDYSKVQIFLIDVESFKSDSLLFCSLLRQNKFTKNTHLVFLLQQNFSEDELTDLTKTFNAITLREKNHPLDILKFIKDRLQIDDSEANKRLNLMIESSPRKRETIHDSLKPTIMIVDDDEDTLFTIGELLKELNCSPVYAHNGMECLLMLNHILPDLIFLDIMMPTMDGFETIKRIRSSSRTAKIPVIALTAYAMLENKEVIEKNGFNDLVTKPVDSSTISSKINSYIKVRVF